jgi:hypothetical protein
MLALISIKTRARIDEPKELDVPKPPARSKFTDFSAGDISTSATFITPLAMQFYMYLDGDNTMRIPMPAINNNQV